MSIISAILVLIFGVLSGFHFYWVLGGKVGLANALPQNTSGDAMMAPGRLVTLIVAVILGLMALYYAILGGWVAMRMPFSFLKHLTWILPTMFALRAIGDFRYVGFFKKITQTDFAKYDSYLYTPLCGLIAIMGYYIWFKS